LQSSVGPGEEGASPHSDQARLEIDTKSSPNGDLKLTGGSAAPWHDPGGDRENHYSRVLRKLNAVEIVNGREPPASIRTQAASAEWRGKLVNRHYLEDAKLVAGPELSARIEHAGESAYFPLGTSAVLVAAGKAEEIHRFVCEKGWAAAKGVYPRELTVAFFWTASPLTCTYTSLYSVPGKIPELWQYPPSKSKTCRVVLVEPEECVRKAAAFWIDRQPGFFCAAALDSICEAIEIARRERPNLLLVNRALMEQPGALPLGRLRERLPEVQTFGFGIFEESNYIFHSVTGVKSGYLLCRRPPGKVFEPIQRLGNQPGTPHSLLEREVLDYFQSLFAGRNENRSEVWNLTSREHDVLAALARGLTEKEVATALNISTQTVHNHVKSIYSKFDAHSRTEVVVKYLGH